MRETESMDVSDAECMEADGMSEGAHVEVGGDGSCVLKYTDKAGCSVSVEGETSLDFYFKALFTENMRPQIVT